jgi:hypothetical protein
MTDEGAGDRDTPRRLCPSTDMSDNSVLHGVLTPDGRIAHISPPIPVAVLRSYPLPDHPDRVMRFAGTCAEHGCRHWDKGDHQCNLIAAIASNVDVSPERELPVCGIRPQCRWYEQMGAGACSPCSHITRSVAEPTVDPITNQGDSHGNLA